jgi:hypothetical protein
MAIEVLRSEFLCILTCLVASPRDIGATARGTRRYYPAIGGSFEGPRLRGEVLARWWRLAAYAPGWRFGTGRSNYLKNGQWRVHLPSVRRNAAWTAGSYGAAGTGRDRRSERILFPSRAGYSKLEPSAPLG